jgi:hypothetical protein
LPQREGKRFDFACLPLREICREGFARLLN